MGIKKGPAKKKGLIERCEIKIGGQGTFLFLFLGFTSMVFLVEEYNTIPYMVCTVK